MRAVRRRSMAILIAAAALPIGACSSGGEAGPGGGAPRRMLEFPVEVIRVPAIQVRYSVDAVGSVEAFERVRVTARVPGAVDRVRFAEGSVVEAGQVLVEIEPDRYRLAVESARATLAKEEASLADARAGLARREAVNARTPGLVREEDLETWRTRVRVAEADVAQARVALEQAELNLRDAYVRAPMSGVIETRNVETGQYVQAGATLGSLVRREPLLLRFQVPEQDAARIRVGGRVSFTVPGGGTEFAAAITHVAEEADAGSRMVQITARVDDPRREQLRPGAFAQVVVPVGETLDAAVVPQTAIRPTERGFVGYVVENGTARERILILGLRTPDGRVEVRQGLQPGETLVVRGAEALRDGAVVRISGAGEVEP